MKDENYIVIQGWMISKLNLKGNELLIYSIIYGFSQTENQVFNGSLQYLSEWTNSTKQGVIKSIKSLIDKGYIEKNEKYINKVKFCEYYATKFNGVVNKVEQGGKQSLPNNIEYNINNNTYNSYNNKSIYETFEKNLGRTLAPIEYEKIELWKEDIEEELIEYALKIAILNNKKNFSYINAILRNWKTSGYKTKQEVVDGASAKISNSDWSISSKIDKDLLEYDWFEENIGDE